MTSILGRIFRGHKQIQADSYETAMRASDELIEQMRASQASPDPVRQTIAGIWEHRKNGPFVVTVFESTQEMLAPMKQQR